MDYHDQLRIKELSPEERPRERLQELGPGALSDGELLAIILRTGARKYPATELARQLKSHFGDLKGVAAATIEELCELDGIGPAKAIQIQAAVEIGRRLTQVQDSGKRPISCSADVRALVWPKLHDKKEEHFLIVLLDAKNRPLKTKTVTIGILDSSIIHPREVFKNAIRASAAHVILVHNHPSGDPAPSRDDVETTRRLCEAGKVVGIEVLDHVIVGEKGHYSFKDEGKM